MEIRLANSGDVQAINRLYHVLSEEYVDNPVAILISLKFPTTRVFVLENDEGAVVGTVTVSWRAIPSHGLVAYVDNLVVDGAFQGRGFGRALAAHCIRFARALTCCGIELTSNPERADANHLYQKLGFTLRETNSYVMNL